MIEGLIKRHAFYIQFDPYANAFRIDTSYVFNDWQKAAGRHDYISTWNYELDSGAYFLRMIYAYSKAVPDAPILKDTSVRDAAALMVSLWETEQRHEEDVALPGYYNPAKKTSLYRYPGPILRFRNASLVLFLIIEVSHVMKRVLKWDTQE